MPDGKAQTRLTVGIVLLILTGPFVLPQVDWGTADMVWLVIWGGIIGLLAYPVAALWSRLTANRRGPTS